MMHTLLISTNGHVEHPKDDINKQNIKRNVAENLLIITSSRHRCSILQFHLDKNHIRVNSTTVFHVLDRCDNIIHSHFCLIYFIKKKCPFITNKTFIYIFYEVFSVSHFVLRWTRTGSPHVGFSAILDCGRHV
jgi:hypothetical protein